MRQRSHAWRILSLAMLSSVFASAAGAQDVVRVAVPQRGTWETSVPDLGEQAKIFAKHGVKIEALYTSGGGETMQALIAGSVDVAISTGTAAVFAAYVKGAPIRPVATSVTGAREIFWYVKANSPIKTLKDAAGKTMAFSAIGSSSNLATLKLIKMAGVDIKPFSTGAPVATFTQTMTGQVDIGWSAAPFALGALQEKRIRDRRQCRRHRRIPRHERAASRRQHEFHHRQARCAQAVPDGLLGNARLDVQER